MADYNNTGSFKTVAEDSELLHRPVQSFAVRGQAAFLCLCVRLHVPVLTSHQNAGSLWNLAPSGNGASAFVFGHTGDGWTLNLGQNRPSTFSSAWFSKWLGGPSNIKVRHVCKRIQVGRASDDSRHLASIANEVRILANRCIRSSANIVALIAVSWCETPDPLSGRFWPQLLLEQAELGTLDACLTQNNLPKATKFMLYRDVLDGLRYLHANGVVHGDVKPQNVLLSHDAASVVDERHGLLPITAKLCDFGYSVILSDYHESLPFRARMGTWPWSAPELDGATSIPASLLPSTDVYSAGLLIVSIIRDGKTPFSGMSRAQVSAAKKRNTYLVLDQMFRELGQSYALGAPRGLTYEQMGKVFMLVAKAMVSSPVNRVGIDGLISAWDEVLQLGITECRRWRGASCSAPEWSRALHDMFLDQRYPPNYEQTEQLARLDDPSGQPSPMLGQARDDGPVHSYIELTPDLCYEYAMMPSFLPAVAAKEILEDLERQVASNTTVLSAEAHFALAGCHINGSLTDQDYSIGMAHLRKAAELKHAGAMACLPGIQAALGDTASSPGVHDANRETRSELIGADCCTALGLQLTGLLVLKLDGFLTAAMDTAIRPQSLAWKSSQEAAYHAYRSSPQRLADARYVLSEVNERRGTPPADDTDAVLSAADKRCTLHMFLHYILRPKTSLGPAADSMAILFREMFKVTGGVDINAPGNGGFTVLQHAVLAGNHDAVSSAIAFGAEVDATGYTPGWTPLWLSVVTGQGAVARLLLDKGASTDCRDTRTGATLLHLLHQLTAQEDIDEVLRAVLQSDAGVPAIDNLASGMTPLLACFVGWDYSDGKAARALLTHGANPTFELNFGLRPSTATTPINLCAATLDYPLMSYMADCPWAASYGNQPPGQRALAIASAEAYVSVLANTEFYYRAILGGRFSHALDEFLKLIVTADVIKLLWEMFSRPAGAEPDSWIHTPMALALLMSRAYISHALLCLFPCDHIPLSPLQRPLIQIAIERRMRATVVDLLKRGADLLELDQRGYTALHAAADYYPNILLELVNYVEMLPPSTRGARTMKQILQSKAGSVDVRSLLLFGGCRTEQHIITDLRARFDLDMDSYDMSSGGMTLTGICVGLIAAAGSVPMSQLEYLLKTSPKPAFMCDATGTLTLLSLAISSNQGRSRTAPTVTRRLVTVLLDNYLADPTNLLNQANYHFHQAVRSGNVVALKLMEKQLRRVTPPEIRTSQLLHSMLHGDRGSSEEADFNALEITREQMALAKTKGGLIRAIRPREYFDALEMYVYLRQRGGTLPSEGRGCPLRLRMVYEGFISYTALKARLCRLATEVRVDGAALDREPMVFTHNPADPDVAEAIRNNPRIEKGACHLSVILLTWHFDAFYIHRLPLRVSPLRMAEHLEKARSQIMAEPRWLYNEIFKRRPALTANDWNDGPWKARTYTESVPQTTERITWTRPGRIWTETEVTELCKRFEDAWEKLFGELENMNLGPDGRLRAIWDAPGE